MLNAHARLRTPTRAAGREGENGGIAACIVLSNEQPSDDAGCHEFLGFAFSPARSPQHKLHRRSGLAGRHPNYTIITHRFTSRRWDTDGLRGTRKDPRYPWAATPATASLRGVPPGPSDGCLSAGRRPNRSPCFLPSPLSSVSSQPPALGRHAQGEAQSELGIFHPFLSSLSPPAGS
ncbi:hypothetical protein LZ31DRAFT_191230 [Colletotrichum somersetense]|nr:hypothetical protein LZ31DRAFT_191230 [Colletotrichum somersetense]